MTTPKASDGRTLLRDALAVMFKRKRLILGLFLIVAVGISAAVLSVPASFEVTGKLVVTRARGDMLVTAGDSKNFNYGLTAPSVQDMAVHADLLKTRSLLERVAKKLGLDRRRHEARATTPTLMSLGQVFALIPERFQGWLPWPSGSSPSGDGTPAVRTELDKAVDRLAAGLAVQVVPNSNLILVRFRGEDPAKGAEVLNALLEMYLDHHLELRRPRGVTDFFVSQRERLEEVLRKSEQDLKAFQERFPLLSAPTQIDAYAKRLAEADNSLLDAQSDMQEHTNRLEALRARIAQEPDRIVKSQSVKYNPLIHTIRERLLTLQLQREKLLSLYTDNDRRVQDIDREIGTLKDRLAQAESVTWVPDAEVTERNGVKTDLVEKVMTSELLLTKGDIRIARARDIGELMRKRLRDIALAEIEKERLVREIQSNSEAYLLYRKKVEEARITEAMDDSRIMNVTIGDLASPRGTPVGAPKNLSLLFAVAVGLVSGIGGAFLREFFDGSIKTEGEIRSAVDLPVLGSIGEEKNGKNGKGNGKNGNGNGKNGNGHGKNGNGKGGNGYH
jgi:uncharacterized protein involved in exopolysaccharide biosynthesis